MAKKKVRKKGKKSEKATVLDFSGVSAGGRKKIPEGDYPLKVDKCYEDEGDKGPMAVFELVVTDGKHKGTRGWLYCSFSKKSLWKLRSTLEALGVDVPESRMKLRWHKFVGLECGGTFEDDKYEGKTRSKLTDLFPLADLEDSEGGDEEESDEEEEDETEEDDDEEVVDDEEEEDED